MGLQLSPVVAGGGSGGGGGSSTFIGLTDVPASYTGSALKIARVNAGETALEFATTVPVTQGGTGAATFTDAGVLLGNGTGAVQVTTAGTAGQVLTSNGAGVDPTFQAATGGLSMGVVQSVYMGNAFTFITALS